VHFKIRKECFAQFEKEVYKKKELKNVTVSKKDRFDKIKVPLDKNLRQSYEWVRKFNRKNDRKITLFKLTVPELLWL